MTWRCKAQGKPKLNIGLIHDVGLDGHLAAFPSRARPSHGRSRVAASPSALVFLAKATPNLGSTKRLAVGARKPCASG
jgi:hypothetical protein